MTVKDSEANVVTMEELIWANIYTSDALVQILIEKGIITEQEFFTKLKQVQADYQAKGRDRNQ